MRGFHRFTAHGLLTGAAVVAFAATNAQAQTASNNATQAASDDSTVPADIVVTAQKRTERLQDVPASVSVLSTRDLTKQGIVRFEDYTGKIPGLTQTSVRAGQSQVVVRGITTGAAQAASTTGFYVDEAPIGSVNAYNGGSQITPDLDPSDLAQIEVLKGPQGTLYGAGAVGGLLKFVTSQPDFTHFGGRVSASGTTVDHGNLGYAMRGMINAPLVTDKLVVRLSGFQRQDPGYIDNINPLTAQKNNNGALVRGFRGLVAAKLGAIRIDLQAIGQDTKVDGQNVEDVDAATLKPIAGDLTQNRFTPERSFVKFRLYNATVKADLGPIQLTSATTYQHSHLTATGDGTRGFGTVLGPLLKIPGGLLGIRTNESKYSERWVQEFRGDAKGLAGGLFDAQIGLYYTHEDDINSIPTYDAFLPSTGAALAVPNLVTASITTTYQEYSAYGNVTLHLGDRFDLLGGVRYSHDKQKYAQDYRGLIIGAAPVLASGRETGNITTWLASPRFRIDPNNMIYARVATGYRPGGPNAVTPTGVAPTTFQPDRLTSYEVGYKATLANRMVTLDAALFYTTWKDIQIQTSAGGFNFFVNGGQAVSKGGEVSLTVTPARGLTFGLNGGYTDAHLTTAAPAAGGANGDRLPYVPHITGALTANYTMPAFGDFKWNFGGGLNYVSQRWSDYSGKLRKNMPGYATVDLRAGIDDGRFSLSAFAKNIGDKRAFVVVASEGLAPSNTSGAYYGASVIQPRQIGVEAAFRF